MAPRSDERSHDAQHVPPGGGEGARRAGPVLIAGLCGLTTQAVREAELARELGYHPGLLSLGALRQARETELLAHCRTVAREIPLLGFYLQPAAGGRLLPYPFWRRFVEIPNVVAIKIAPFNLYQTLEVIRAVAEAGRAPDLALYTGNDDHILLDLLTEFRVPTARGEVRVKAVASVETSTSYGGAMRGGNLVHELRASLYDLEKRPLVTSFMAGLGGDVILIEDFEYMANILTQMVQEKKTRKHVYWIGFEE